jgi:hypothetical protein
MPCPEQLLMLQNAEYWIVVSVAFVLALLSHICFYVLEGAAQFSACAMKINK